MNCIATVVAGLSLAFVGTSATIADTINVPGDQPTIAAAISASSWGDVINIAAGTYNEHTLDPGGKAITIQGTLNGDGSLATTIDAQQGGSVFKFNHHGTGLEDAIKNLVITGGSSNEGSGIYCNNSSPLIENCTITGNTATQYGGGIICLHGSAPIIFNCTIQNNEASGLGGGILCYNSDPTINGCTILLNQAGSGSGIFCDYSNLTIIDCTLSGNSAYYQGGGIFCNNSSTTIIDITGCTISGNTADNGWGGGIYSNDSNPTISGSQICGNEPNQIHGSYNASETCIEQSCDPCTSDSDDDGVLDYLDQCPGYDDNADADGDGTADGCDNCPDDPLKTEPGDCGCSELETDTDLDGTPDCIDGCPDDPLKIEPGVCGCDVAETTVIGDLDCDGDYDIDDAYAAMANFGIDEAGECAGDTNNDGVIDIEDLLNMLSNFGSVCP